MNLEASQRHEAQVEPAFSADAPATQSATHPYTIRTSRELIPSTHPGSKDECPVCGDVQRIQMGVRNFQDDMRAKEIHVGMPGRDRVVRCVTCGGVWPCAGSAAL